MARRSRRFARVVAGLWIAFVVPAADAAAPVTFERGECPFAVAEPLRDRLVCGRLDVPERHERPDAARIRLPVAIVRSTNPSPAPDPVVFLAGGPGAAPLASAHTVERFAQHPFARDRDVIVYNQRGSPQTDPALVCGALEASRLSLHAADLSLQERDARLATTAIACLEEMRAAGRDLDAYGAEANARDLAALRGALGIRQWNLLAVSYGTWMALEAARFDAQGVRSLVLDSVMSAQSDLFLSEASRNFSLGVDRVLAACADDAECARSFPHLPAKLRAIIEALEARPATLKLSVAGSTEPAVVVVNWHDFLGVLHWMLYNGRTLRLVPLLIELTSRGDTNLLAQLMEQVYPGTRSGAPGPTPAFFAIVCRDQFTRRNPLPTAPGNPDHRGFSIVGFMPRVCANVVGAAVSRPVPVRVRATVPTLLLSGRFDPMTPDVYALEVAADLPRATRITIQDSGHSTLSDFEACQTRVAQQFLARPGTTPGHRCLSEPHRPHFALHLDETTALLPAR